MNKEQFHDLKPGDILSLHGVLFTIKMAERYYRTELEKTLTHTVANDKGLTIKVIDPWLKNVRIVAIGETMDNGDVIDPATGEITYEAPKEEG